MALYRLVLTMNFITSLPCDLYMTGKNMTLESDLSKINISGPSANIQTPPPSPTPSAPASPAISPLPSPPPPPSPSPAPSPAPDSFSLRTYAQERGYDPNAFKDDQELAAALLQAADQYQQIEPLANIGRQFAPYVDRLGEFNEFIKAKEVEAKAAAEEAQKKAAIPVFDWQKAEYDASLEQYCKFNAETGRYEARHPDWSPHARKLNEAIEARRQNSQRLVDKFPELLDQYYGPREAALREKILAEALELVRKEFTQRNQQTATEQWIQEREKDLYVFDAGGKPIIDVEGMPRLSPKGEALRAHAEDLSKSGITDPEKIREYAWRAVVADEASGKFGAPAKPIAAPTPPAHPTNHKRFLDRFANRGGEPPQRLQQRGGSIPDDTAPRTNVINPSSDLMQISRRIANEQGIQL